MGETGEMYSEESLDLLEAKINALEIKVFGGDSSFEKGVGEVGYEAENIVDSLVKSETVMRTAISGQEKIGKLAKRMDELDAALDPLFETTAVQNAAKIEMLLLMYDELSDMSTKLKHVKESAAILNSEQIRAIPKVEDRLNTLIKTMHDNKVTVENQNSNMHDVLTNYNRLVNSFTRTFAQFDKIITELEIASQAKKELE